MMVWQTIAAFLSYDDAPETQCHTDQSSQTVMKVEYTSFQKSNSKHCFIEMEQSLKYLKYLKNQIKTLV